MMKKLTAVMLLLLMGLLVACGGGTEDTDDEALTALKQEFAANYADIAFATYGESLAGVLAMQGQTEAFVSGPSVGTLSGLRRAWTLTREPFSQTGPFRFDGSPIAQDDLNALIGAWPVDGAYIDYVMNDPTAGIVNNPADYPEITPENLVAWNQVGAPTNVSAGFHAIEFLLWGEDNSQTASGQRPFEDFTTADNADRRGTYLLAANDLLIDNLGAVVDNWDSAMSGNYRETFLAQDPDDALEQILIGLIVFSQVELAEKSLSVPFETSDFNLSPSTFSDFTNRELINGVRGIDNVYKGTYTLANGNEVSGVGLNEVVAAVDPDLAQDTQRLIDEALEAMNLVRDPFDQAISIDPTRGSVAAAIAAMNNLTNGLIRVAETMGVAVDLPPAE